MRWRSGWHDCPSVLSDKLLAAIFSGSDRARMMIFSVLLENYDEYRTEIEEIVTSLEKMLGENAQSI
jgi:hypothetical protein